VIKGKLLIKTRFIKRSESWHKYNNIYDNKVKDVKSGKSEINLKY